MAPTISLPTTHSPKGATLEEWMNRVLDRGQRVTPGWRAGDVHDLRVALRRCRAIAEALSEVNPDSGWRKLKKASRDLFRALGELHDTQVERSRVKKLGPASDPARKKMLTMLSGRERKRRRIAERALDQFDRKEWKKLAHKLSSKACFFPLGSVVFQRLALARLTGAAQLYHQARLKPSNMAWHQLRLGLKNFRYVVENFLPQQHNAWSEEMKRMQNLLGEVHDLYVLRDDIRIHASTLGSPKAAQWIDKIERERKENLQQFLAKTGGAKSPWLVWRGGFQLGHALSVASPEQRQTA